MFGRDEEVLKGENPWSTENWKKRRNARPTKQKIYEWLRDHCNEYHPEGHNARLAKIIEQSEKIESGELTEYNEDDDYFKPSFYLFFYNVYKKFLNRTPFYWFRMKLQRMFRKNKLADCDIWNANYVLSKKILDAVVAYKKSDRHGYPGTFSEYNDHEWKCKEDYDAKIANGDMIGGGPDAWEKILDKIIMAFEYLVNDGNREKEKEWFTKYFGFSPYDENECNLHISYSYKPLDAKKNIGSVMSSTMPDLDTVEWCTKSTSYLNMDLIFYAEEYVNEGCELFGKFFRNLWD